MKKNIYELSSFCTAAKNGLEGPYDFMTFDKSFCSCHFQWSKRIRTILFRPNSSIYTFYPHSFDGSQEKCAFLFRHKSLFHPIPTIFLINAISYPITPICDVHHQKKKTELIDQTYPALCYFTRIPSDFLQFLSLSHDYLSVFRSIFIRYSNSNFTII